MSIEEKLEELQIRLPKTPEKGGVYAQTKDFGEHLVYVSGCGPQDGGKSEYIGKLGGELTLEQGQAAARNCMLNVLAILNANLGGLEKIKRFVKILAFVSSQPDFYQQPQVVNAASSLLVDLFGEEVGMAARSAVGVNALPGNIAVEIEVLVELY